MLKRSIYMSLMAGFLISIGACETTGVRPDTPSLSRNRNEQRVRVLMLAVSFQDVTPSSQLSMIRKRLLDSAARYYEEVSYGKTRIIGDVRGWYCLPHPLDYYKLSPYIFERENRTRVRRLAQDALNAAEKDVTYEKYEHIIIVVGVFTTFRKGYGQHALCANPGYMSLGTGARMEKIVTKGGQSFDGGIVVVAPNTHPGNVVHDLAHAMGGVADGRRLIPDLYSHKLFDKAMAEIDRGKASRPNKESYADLTAKFTVYMGPWDVMSLWFVKYDLPPAGMSSFTRQKLGWLGDGKVAVISPGERRVVTLSPLTSGKGTLAVRIPVTGGIYYLLENRQKEGRDRLMPASGLLVLKVDESRRDEEGVVRVVNANPHVPNFKAATFGIKRKQNPSVNMQKDGAVEVLWQKDNDLTILVTARSRDSEIQEMAKRVRETYKKSDFKAAKMLLTEMGFGDFE